MDAPFATDEPLQVSPVFRRLENAQGGAYRLNRYDEVDLLIIAVPYWLHLVLEIVFAGNALRPVGTVVAMAVAVWVLKTRFPDGFLPLLRALGMPRRLSSLARDRGFAVHPYAPRRPTGRGDR